MTMTKAPPRRRAVQARSRATVERILASALSLIAERGPEAVTMTEIASRAQVVIGSLYQYFPDKAGVMAALIEQHNAGVREMLEAAVAGAASLDDLAARTDGLVARYFALNRDDPVFHGMWAAMRTDPMLQALDVEDSLRNGRVLFRAARPLYRKVDEDRLMATCALGMHLALTAARFALAIPAPLGAFTPGIYSAMVRAAFLGLEEG